MCMRHFLPDAALDGAHEVVHKIGPIRVFLDWVRPYNSTAQVSVVVIKWKKTCLRRCFYIVSFRGPRH